MMKPVPVMVCSLLAVCGIAGPAASQEATNRAATRKVLFHIGGQDLFDKTLSFRRQGKRDGARRVIVDLEGAEAYCPIEMGRWISGGRGACELEFRFRNDFHQGQYWLHVVWRGRTNRKDQFEVFCNDQLSGTSSQAEQNTGRSSQYDRFPVRIKTGQNRILLKLVSPFTQALRFKDIALCGFESMDPLPLPACPTARIVTLEEYEQAISEAGMVMDGKNVRLFVPRAKERAAKRLFPVLAKAYDRFHLLAGKHTDYKVAVLALPNSSPHCTGRANLACCAIPYGYELLDVDDTQKWPETLGTVLRQMKRLFQVSQSVDVDIASLLQDTSRFEMPVATLLAGDFARRRQAKATEHSEAHKRTYSEDVLFHIGGDGLFDKTLSFLIRGSGEAERRVVVDLGARKIYCPIEMGERITQWTRVSTMPGQAKGAGILEFLFPNDFEARDYWLHIVWQANSATSAQFAVFCNGQPSGVSRESTASDSDQWHRERFRVSVRRGQNRIRLKLVRPQSVVKFKDVALCRYGNLETLPRPACPTVVLRNLAEYEEAIREPGVMLDSQYVRLFAPQKMEQQARIIFPYIERGYDAFYRMVGMHTNYKVVVYASPPWSPHCWGGTATQATIIPYGYSLLDLDSQEEWKRHRVPRLIGLFEEMGHDFTLGLGMRFGGEAIGSYLSGKVAMDVTANPYRQTRRQAARKMLQETMQRYIDNGYVFPEDIPGGVSDRIHTEILYRCEEKYGPDFWPDFFTQVRKQYDRLRHADGDARYRITVDCFDRLAALHFRQMLRELRISATTSWYSLRPAQPQWDRRFIPPAERNGKLR